MGRRFQCRWPQDGAQVLTMEPEPAVRQKADGQKALNIKICYLKPRKGLASLRQ